MKIITKQILIALVFLLLLTLVNCEQENIKEQIDDTNGHLIQTTSLTYTKLSILFKDVSHNFGNIPHFTLKKALDLKTTLGLVITISLKILTLSTLFCFLIVKRNHIQFTFLQNLTNPRLILQILLSTPKKAPHLFI